MLKNRQDAGRRLAEQLRRFKDRSPVILALPRGGVPVAFEVAQVLEAPLDLVLVRKIGAPWQPELAVGAVADGPAPVTVFNRDVLEALGLRETDMQPEVERKLAEIETRRRLYLEDRPRPEVEGCTAIVIDDGIATGATTRAALRAVRAAQPSHTVLAVPVAPPDSLELLRPEVDDIVCLETPVPFGAISLFYRSFPQLSDTEVMDLLRQVRGSGQARPPGP